MTDFYKQDTRLYRKLCSCVPRCSRVMLNSYNDSYMRGAV